VAADAAETKIQVDVHLAKIAELDAKIIALSTATGNTTTEAIIPPAVDHATNAANETPPLSGIMVQPDHDAQAANESRPVAGVPLQSQDDALAIGSIPVGVPVEAV